MDLNKNIKSIVITYTTEECVMLKYEEAEKFREVLQELVSVYALSSITQNKPFIDLNNYFNYETIRNPAKIVYK